MTMDVPTGILIGLVVFILFIAIYERAQKRREKEDEKMCLYVLRSSVKTHYLLETDGCAKRCATSPAVTRATLERLSRNRLVEGFPDEDNFWYWKITEEGKKSLIQP